MLRAEPYLLQAVEAIRTALGLGPEECDVEYDSDFVPQTAGDVHVTVSPEGARPGPLQDSSGGVYDVFMGCRVTVFLRSRNTPRDRRRSLYMGQVEGLNSLLDTIIRGVDWERAVILRANALLQTSEASSYGFMPGSPLRIVSIDSKPRPVVGDVYGAGSRGTQGADTYAGLARGIVLGGARRVEHQ